MKIPVFYILTCGLLDVPLIMLSTKRKEKRYPSSQSLSLLSCDVRREGYNLHSLSNNGVYINPSKHSLTKLSKSIDKGSSRPIFENERVATSIRSIGSMLSGLSKSNSNRGMIPREEQKTKQKNRPNKREIELHKKKISKIESMKQVYMQQRLKDADVNYESVECSTKSPDAHIKQYNKQRNTGYLPDYSINKETHFYEDTQGADRMKDSLSMIELIEWLEKVDLDGIDDFV